VAKALNFYFTFYVQIYYLIMETKYLSNYPREKS